MIEFINETDKGFDFKFTIGVSYNDISTLIKKVKKLDKTCKGTIDYIKSAQFFIYEDSLCTYSCGIDSVAKIKDE